MHEPTFTSTKAVCHERRPEVRAQQAGAFPAVAPMLNCYSLILEASAKQIAVLQRILPKSLGSELTSESFTVLGDLRQFACMAQYDVVIFGATGFTGSLILKYFQSKGGYRLAVCGRNQSKLEKAIEGFQSKPDVYVLDVVNATQDELKEVVKKAKCVCTAVGPFVEYGEPLVQACAELGVDYVDTSGESTFMRKMIEKYDAAAKQSGSRIVIHCGQDCVPWDLAVWKLWKLLGSELTGVKIFGEMRSCPSGGTMSTAMLNMQQKPSKSSLGFDPLYLADGAKSECLTQVDLPKGSWAATASPRVEAAVGRRAALVVL